eukprot:4225468-Amphidinium_carterae.1
MALPLSHTNQSFAKICSSRNLMLQHVDTINWSRWRAPLSKGGRRGCVLCTSSAKPLRPPHKLDTSGARTNFAPMMRTTHHE